MGVPSLASGWWGGELVGFFWMVVLGVGEVSWVGAVCEQRVVASSQTLVFQWKSDLNAPKVKTLPRKNMKINEILLMEEILNNHLGWC